jgi:hypothetical protein
MNLDPDVNPYALNNLMEFDHVIQVHEDGTVTEPSGIWAPSADVDIDDEGQILEEHEKEMIRDVKSQGWNLLTGYSGQYRYSGPIMHSSEYVGGQLAKDILSQPGYYVTTDVITLGPDQEIAGWVVAYKDA